MSVESRSLGARQSEQASIHSNPFEDFAMDEDQATQRHDGHATHDTNPPAESMSQPDHFLCSDFDIQNEFWPSSAHTLRRSNSSTSLPRDHSQDQNQTTLQNRATTSYQRVNTSSRRIRDPSALPRVDLFARNTLREMILSAVLSEVAPPERTALLNDCKESADASNLGIPFREILSEPMDHLGVTPLMFEIMGCQPDWDGINDPELGSGLEMVLYLIDNWSDNVLAHGKMGICMNVVRTACLRRFDEHEGNRLFQYLRPVVGQLQAKQGQRVFDYDISIAPLGGSHGDTTDNQRLNLDFTALISIPHFASRLTQPQSSEMTGAELRSTPCRKPPSSPTSTHVSVEFLAARRAWRLKVDSNLLALELLDGPGGTITSDPNEQSPVLVDARVKVITPERGEPMQTFASASAAGADAPVELFLPRTQLRPIDAAEPGTSEAKLSPCFYAVPGDYSAISGLDDERLLHDGRGALLLELTVRFGNDSSEYTFIDIRNNAPRPVASTLETAPSENARASGSVVSDDDLYVPSEVDLTVRMDDMDLDASPAESEWEQVSEVDETEVKEGGWVKASWSGRDEEL